MAQLPNKQFSPFSRASSNLPIIVFAPQGSGLSLRRHDVAAHLHRQLIVDEWSGSTNVPADSVLLTNDPAFENVQRWRGRPDLPVLSVVRFAEIVRHLGPAVVEIARPSSAAPSDAGSDASDLSR